MPTMEWSRPAASDHSQIASCFAPDEPSVALDLIERIEAGLNRVVEYPELGRTGRLAGTREWPIRRTPFVAVYVIRRDRIRLLRILHGVRPWP